MKIRVIESRRIVFIDRSEITLYKDGTGQYVGRAANSLLNLFLKHRIEGNFNRYSFIRKTAANCKAGNPISNTVTTIQ